MIKLGTAGAWLINGNEVVGDDAEAAQIIKAKTGRDVSKEDASKETMAYSILKKHNKSDSMDKLKIRFDKLTSHDITFVGIIQTARASGLERFPMPYVLTNCHNSLCAVGGTINEDDHMFGLSCSYIRPLSSCAFSISSVLQIIRCIFCILAACLTPLKNESHFSSPDFSTITATRF